MEQKHQHLIITPERFLERAQVKERRSLVFLIFKKLQVELDPNALTASHYLGSHSANLYTLAFHSPESAQQTEKEIITRHDLLLPEIGYAPTDVFRFLPPLFLLSCTKFVIIYDDLTLIAQKDGPIIPVVCLKSVRERSDSMLIQLTKVYGLDSTEYMTLDKLNALLTVPLSPPPASIDEKKSQKNMNWTPP